MGLKRPLEDLCEGIYDLDDYPDPRDYFDPAEAIDDFRTSIARADENDPPDECELDLN